MSSSSRQPHTMLSSSRYVITRCVSTRGDPPCVHVYVCMQYSSVLYLCTILPVRIVSRRTRRHGYLTCRPRSIYIAMAPNGSYSNNGGPIHTHITHLWTVCTIEVHTYVQEKGGVRNTNATDDGEERSPSFLWVKPVRPSVTVTQRRRSTTTRTTKGRSSSVISISNIIITYTHTLLQHFRPGIHRKVADSSAGISFPVTHEKSLVLSIMAVAAAHGRRSSWWRHRLCSPLVPRETTAPLLRWSWSP